MKLLLSISMTTRELGLLLVVTICFPACSGNGSGNRLPHSTRSEVSAPSWNPSVHIKDDGFLVRTYRRTPGPWEAEAQLHGKYGVSSAGTRSLTEVPTTVRQVPGDGNCLFHSIAACLSLAVNGTHLTMNENDGSGGESSFSLLHTLSRQLRHLAVDRLEKHPRRLLFLQGREYLRACDLVGTAANPYGLSGEEYCRLMRRDSYWGGGPEIVALCNALRRPIHVYELCCTDQAENSKGAGRNNKYFMLRRLACFGSPKFDRNQALHILSADSRFPDIEPGEHLTTGNHFLALFPEPVGNSETRWKRKKSIRGGGGGGSKVGWDAEDTRTSKQAISNELSTRRRSLLAGIGTLIISLWSQISILL